MLMAMPVPAAAQAAAAPTLATTPDQTVEFTAEAVTYDSNADVVTATGAVRMDRDGNYLAADKVIWNRKTGQVYAQGNVVLLTPQGERSDGRA
jgi:LPS-assembly protein